MAGLSAVRDSSRDVVGAGFLLSRDYDRTTTRKYFLDGNRSGVQLQHLAGIIAQELRPNVVIERY